MVGYVNMEPPDLAQPVMGWRRWRESLKGELTATVITEPAPTPPGTKQGTHWQYTQHAVWSGKLMKARCIQTPYYRCTSRASVPHEVPNRECHCGLYAFHEKPKAWTEATSGFMGLVRAWGVVIAHDDGFRAEWMEIVALRYKAPYPIYKDSKTGETLCRRARRMAAKLGVPYFENVEYLEKIYKADSAIPQHLRGERNHERANDGRTSASE